MQYTKTQHFRDEPNTQSTKVAERVTRRRVTAGLQAGSQKADDMRKLQKCNGNKK
ncbi:hypothetical protein CEXT_496671, partial [Caerostris extrusa]